MKGWFDAFRYNGGPTLYSFNNRTGVGGDATLITIFTVFGTIFVAFLIIFPGVRKERFSTFYAVTLSLFIGATILTSLYGSSWHVSQSFLNGTYTAFSNEKLQFTVGVYIGLSHVNITLQASTSNHTSDIDFNEQFVWKHAEQMAESFVEAIERGLPFPILSVAEYFSTGTEGLSWGSKYRTAGYFANIMLWTSFVIWLLMNLMLVVVPRYGALLMTTCGFLLLATTCGYFAFLPEMSLVIHIEGKGLHFSFGWCFWIVLIAGAICLVSGVIITTVEIVLPHSFSTIFEVDYDTPYDRHIIIEDSRGRRLQLNTVNNNKTENREGFGTKILRRLSLKSAASVNRDKDPIYFVEQNGQNFEMDTLPEWRYPFRQPVNNYDLNSISSYSHSAASTNSHDPHSFNSRAKPTEVSLW